jgi:hypothetical protein
MITITPIRPIIEPIISLFLGFSWRRKKEAMIRKIGPAEPIIAALILGASSNPKKKKAMFTVTPRKPIKKTSAISCFSTLRYLYEKGRIIIVERANLRHARVKGGMSCSAHLNIGGAAPQMIFATIKAITAALK